MISTLVQTGARRLVQDSKAQPDTEDGQAIVTIVDEAEILNLGGKISVRSGMPFPLVSVWSDMVQTHSA